MNATPVCENSPGTRDSDGRCRTGPVATVGARTWHELGEAYGWAEHRTARKGRSHNPWAILFENTYHHWE